MAWSTTRRSSRRATSPIPEATAAYAAPRRGRRRPGRLLRAARHRRAARPRVRRPAVRRGHRWRRPGGRSARGRRSGSASSSPAWRSRCATPTTRPANVRRVVAAVDEARDEGTLGDDVPVFVEMPGPPTSSWLAAADEVAAADLRLKLRLGHVDHDLIPERADRGRVDRRRASTARPRSRRPPACTAPYATTPRAAARTGSSTSWSPRRSLWDGGTVADATEALEQRDGAALAATEPARLGPPLVHLVRLLLGHRAPRRPDRPGARPDGRAKRMTAQTWVEGAAGSGFDVDHLPYGVFARSGEHPRVAVRIGDQVLDLSIVAAADMVDTHALFDQPTLNPFLAAGPTGLGLHPRLDHRAAHRRDRARPRRARAVAGGLGEDADAVHHRRLRRLLRLRAPRLQRRPDVPARPGAAAAQLEAPPRRLPRPLGHDRRLGHRRRAPERPAQGTRRRATDVRPVAAPRHRGRAGLRRRRAVGDGRAGARPRTSRGTPSASSASTTGRRATSRPGSTSRSARSSASPSPPRSARG